MINLKVDKCDIEQKIDGRLGDIITELVIGATAILKSVSVNADIYTELRDAFIETVASVEYDEIKEAVGI